MKDLHAHLWNIKVDENDPVAHIDLVAHDIYDGFDDGTDYVQYVYQVSESKWIELCLPLDIIKPEAIERLREHWAAIAAK